MKGKIKPDTKLYTRTPALADWPRPGLHWLSSYTSLSQSFRVFFPLLSPTLFSAASIICPHSTSLASYFTSSFLSHSVVPPPSFTSLHSLHPLLPSFLLHPNLIQLSHSLYPLLPLFSLFFNQFFLHLRFYGYFPLPLRSIIITISSSHLSFSHYFHPILPFHLLPSISPSHIIFTPSSSPSSSSSLTSWPSLPPHIQRVRSTPNIWPRTHTPPPPQVSQSALSTTRRK